MKYLRFFLPLALTSSLMSGAHVLITAVLSRTADPAFSLASYALALGLAAAFEGPVGQSRQLSLSLGSSTRGFRRAWQTTWTVTLTLLVIQAVIAYTPAGLALLARVFGRSPELLSATVSAYRIFMWMGVASAIRFIHQGYLVRHRRTGVVAGGIGLRLIITVVLGLLLSQVEGLPGAVIGAIIILAGVLCEGAVSTFAARPMLAQGVTVPDENPVPTYGQALLFYLPLAGSQLIASVNQPAMNAALALSGQGAFTVAAFAAAQTVSGLVVSPMNSLHQLGLVFGGNQADRVGVLRFAAGVVALATGLLALLAFTPLGEWSLRVLLGLRPEFIGPVRTALRLWILVVPAVGVADYCAGLLLLRRNSRTLSSARIARVMTTVGLAWWLVPGAPFVGEAVVRGMLAFLGGFGVETAINLTAVWVTGDRRPTTKA